MRGWVRFTHDERAAIYQTIATHPLYRHSPTLQRVAMVAGEFLLTLFLQGWLRKRERSGGV